MATIAQLYTRIILDTNRDDMGSGGELEQAKIDAVADAIATYASELFWFNRKTGTASTVASTATVALPSGMRIPLVVSYNQSPLRQVGLEDIEHLTSTGTPTAWAENEGVIQLSPIPDAVYSLKVTGIAELGVPASTNEWTTEAYKLILNEAKLTLYAGPLRDPEGAKLAMVMRDDALSALRRETRRRGRMGLVADLPGSAAFNINTG